MATLLALLREHGIRRLVDVRRIPRSRRHPHVNREDLADSLADAGIGYRHAPALGGMRERAPDSVNQGWSSPGFAAYADHMQTADFDTALQALLADAADTATVMMCAEADPGQCHRWLIADAADARGCTVRHILDGGRTDTHRPTSFARVDDGRVSYPFALTG
ncbi:DUF488 domain-containing protein [Spectribacter hydrogenoxidans]|uniref:DUF488 domain-containing protein n=1 Tax=Spectribacter hydrogenoxidans TaxID=3075608 RepID=A0ABU3BWP9_9GAMM|nr:DUF488 domain-containing protein [Salinisphaera sp. W335]MDT0633718.1 DUF488 domain-containing protein [Salinisphaera sp. W335]